MSTSTSSRSVSLPAERLPIDILHVSDTHFCGWWNQDRRQHWDLFLDSVRTSIAEKEFAPALIAFTGDLVDSPGMPYASRAAFCNGVAALLELASACGFIEQPPPPSQSNGLVPAAWASILNRRLLLVPGNHDVFFKGLRVGWQRWTRRWRDLTGVSGPDSLIGEPSLQLGPLAIRLIDTNGSRAFFKRARGVYEATSAGAEPWPFNTSDRFPVALMHGHPLQLPYLIEGIDSEAGMMVDNSGSLLRDLGALGVRLVLHGHRHLPNVCGVSVNMPDGDVKAITIVAAASVTAPAKQWPYFGYNRIRIEPDRRVSVQLMKREAGQRIFYPVDRAPRTADHGDFEYDLAERTVRITEAGDECSTIRIRGFRIRPDRPDVYSIPFGIASHDGSRVAAVRFVSLRDGSPAPQALQWDQQAGVLRITPPHTGGDDPLDLEMSYCIHNSSPRSRWEARELLGKELTVDDLSETRRCTTRRVSMALQLPNAFGPLSDRNFTVEIRMPDGGKATAPVRWDARLRQASFTIDRPHVGSYIGLQWPLPSGEPRAEEEGRIQIVRAWQADLAREHRDGRRPFDDTCADLQKQLVTAGTGPVDVGIFLVRSTEVIAKMYDSAASPRLLLIGEHAQVPRTEPMTLAYGQGVAGRALRTGGVVWYNRLQAEQTRKDFERGDTSDPPENFYISLADDRNYDVVVGIPIDLAEFAVRGELAKPQWTILVACIGTKYRASPFLRLDADGLKSVGEAAATTRDLLREVIYRKAAEAVTSTN